GGARVVGGTIHRRTRTTGVTFSGRIRPFGARRLTWQPLGGFDDPLLRHDERALHSAVRDMPRSGQTRRIEMRRRNAVRARAILVMVAAISTVGAQRPTV